MDKLAIVLVLLGSSALAQTQYQQSQPTFCNLADYVCNQILLVGGGSYSFVDGSKTLHAGDEFTLFSHIGSITAVQQQVPLVIGDQGQFSFTWSTTDGLKGSVSGYVFVGKTCGRYCWPHAVIENSTVTVN